VVAVFTYTYQHLETPKFHQEPLHQSVLLLVDPSEEQAIAHWPYHHNKLLIMNVFVPTTRKQQALSPVFNTKKILLKSQISAVAFYRLQTTD